MEQSPQAPRDRRQGALLSLNNTPYNCESISALNVSEMLKTKYQPERFQQSATRPLLLKLQSTIIFSGTSQYVNSFLFVHIRKKQPVQLTGSCQSALISATFLATVTLVCYRILNQSGANLFVTHRSDQHTGVSPLQCAVTLNVNKYSNDLQVATT